MTARFKRPGVPVAAAGTAAVPRRPRSPRGSPRTTPLRPWAAARSTTSPGPRPAGRTPDAGLPLRRTSRPAGTPGGSWVRSASADLHVEERVRGQLLERGQAGLGAVDADVAVTGVVVRGVEVDDGLDLRALRQLGSHTGETGRLVGRLADAVVDTPLGDHH